MNKISPKLRADIEAFPAQYRGEQGIVIKDSLGLIPQPVFLGGAAVSILRFLDGTMTITDIQVELMRLQKGLFVSSEDVQRVIDDMDRDFLLETDRYREEKNRLIAAYAAQEVRSAVLAGQAYPDSKDELEDFLDSILGVGERETSNKTGRVKALVAPHIDLEVGRRVYSRAYRALPDDPPTRVVLLGTGHGLLGSYLSFTEKDFTTPLGRAHTDKEIVRMLKDVCGDGGSGVLAPDDFAHRSEHSLEFQVLFLQHVYGSRFCLVPILCGSLEQTLNHVSRLSEIPGISGFLSALNEVVRSPGTLIVAGVDLSHIGPKFGHDRTAAAMRPETEAHDRALIETICRCDAPGLWREIRKANNTFHVCGFSPLAFLLETMPGAKGELLDYEIWMEESTRSAVSFTAISFSDI